MDNLWELQQALISADEKLKKKFEHVLAFKGAAGTQGGGGAASKKSGGEVRTIVCE